MIRRGKPLAVCVVVLTLTSGCTRGHGSNAVPSTHGVAAPTTAAAVALPSLPRQPAGVAFPGLRWTRGPLPAGVARTDLDRDVTRAFASGAAARVRALVVVKGGELVYEAYNRPDRADTLMPSWSIAKSFTSAVIGLLVGDGKLDVDAPAPVKAWADPNDPRHAITIDQLLHMSSGLAWSEDYSNSSGSDVYGMLTAPDASAYAAAKPLVATPGTQWQYSTGTAAILAGIAIDTLGGERPAEHYIVTRLLRPLGITSTRFVHDRSGRWFGGLGADSTAQDFARFGLLYLRGGIWNGSAILPKGWVDFTRTASSTNDRYGTLWWLGTEPGAFTAIGLSGQYVMVVPNLDLVVVVTATSDTPSSALLRSVYARFATAAAGG